MLENHLKLFRSMQHISCSAIAWNRKDRSLIRNTCDKIQTQLKHGVSIAGTLE